ncbi:MAG: hypothetical protein E5299_01054 [Burkholderia gladioli]|nr:MAG: hypothetical protein E5299_01054 [Burkholderia gladioli]
MARLMQLPVTVVENGSNTVATTGDRLPRMRCIGSRPSPATVSVRVTSTPQATEVSVRVVLINRMADLARPQSVRIA